jgi:hypothetical protein
METKKTGFCSTFDIIEAKRKKRLDKEKEDKK